MFVPQVRPAALQPLLDGVRALPVGSHWAAATPQERADWLAGLRQLIDAAEAVFVEALAAFDAGGDGEALHAAGSTASWLRAALKLGPGDAAQKVRLARGSCELLAEPAAALRAGSITFDQLRTIEAGVARLPTWAKSEAVSVLTELATRVDVAALRVAAKHLAAVVDPDGADDQGQQDFSRRYLNLSPLLDGMTLIDGLLDAESAAMVSAALAPFQVPLGPDDRRSAGQRRADGLVELARTTADHGLLPAVSGRKPHLDVMVPLATLAQIPIRTEAACPRRSPRDWAPYFTISGELSMAAPIAGVPAVLTQTPGGPATLSSQALQRLACDAEVARVVMAGPEIPLQLGRSVRLFTVAQRKALALRDGGCRFPGCHRPPVFTDAHHRVPWTAGGRSDLVNGLLLCRHHHTTVHEGGWGIRPANPELGANQRLWFDGPTGQHLPSDPRGP